MRDVTSYTELSMLASCERMWWYRYVDKQEETKNTGMWKGKMIHSLVGAWWIGGDAEDHAWHDFQAARCDAEIEADEDQQKVYSDTAWVYDRYRQHYGKARSSGTLRVIDTELKVVGHLPSTDLDVVTYVDQLVHLKGRGIWAVERKSMYDWRRLATLEVDPQVSITLWQLRNAGYPVQGLLYDAIRTYRWAAKKPTQAQLIEESGINFPTQKAAREWAKAQLESHPGVEAPIEDSFRIEYLDRHEEHIEGALSEMYAAVPRRAMLGAGMAPMRNIGPTCERCRYKDRCWAELQFGQEIVIDDGTPVE